MSEYNVAHSPETQHAGFGIRLKAFLFDYIPIAACIIFLFAATMVFAWAMGALGTLFSWPTNPLVGDLTAFITLVLPVILHFTLQESSSTQAT